VKTMHAFLIRVRNFFAFLTDPLGRFFERKTYRREFGSQRMCPFCGLITSRSKPYCLECGRSLKESHLKVEQE
jgi:hypothetical protein